MTIPALFPLMRDLDNEALEYFRLGREEPGTIPVGAALFDYVIKGAVRLEFVAALRKASTLEEAEAIAVPAVRLWVKKHNERRRDKDWQRWENHGQSDLLALIDKARRILRGSEFISEKGPA